MSYKDILQKIKEQLIEDRSKYMQEGNAFYDFGFYADKLLLAIRLMEGKTHPIKTYADDFFEKFPKAGKFDDGTPYDICVNIVYGTDFHCDESCKDCWNAECKEEE